jgi:inhibitor of cysteine peptidase
VTEIEVTQSGSQVKVAVGDEIVVRIPEIPTSGYAWSVSSVDPQLQVVSDAFVADGGELPAPGAGGQHVVRLRAQSAGHARAVLVLKRPWESSASQTFSVGATIA